MTDFQAEGGVENDVQAFQAEKGLDERCVKGLRDLHPGDQVVIMDIVNNKECKNASAFTWSLVRKINENPGGLRLEFLTRHVDERCLQGLQALPREAQERIASGADVLGTRNLSAWTWSQVRAAQDNMRGMNPGQPPPPPYGHPAHAGAAPGYGSRDRSRTPRAAGGPGHQTGLLDQIRSLRAELVSGGPPRHPPQHRGYPPPPGGQYGGGCGYGGGAAGSTWKGGDGGGKGGKGGYGGGGGLEYEAHAIGLDDKAVQAIGALDEQGQRVVLGLVQKQACRNPSAVAWTHVKAYQQRPAEARLEFLRLNLDPEAAAGLDRLPPEQRDGVVAQVDFARTRNLSAFVWSRVKSLSGPASGAGGAHAELQYGSPPGAAQDVPLDGGAEAGAIDPAQVLGVPLDEKCTTALRELPPEEAMNLLCELNLDNVRNPSAFVWSKIKLHRGQ